MWGILQESDALEYVRKCEPSDAEYNAKRFKDIAGDMQAAKKWEQTQTKCLVHTELSNKWNMNF